MCLHSNARSPLHWLETRHVRQEPLAASINENIAAKIVANIEQNKYALKGEAPARVFVNLHMRAAAYDRGVLGQDKRQLAGQAAFT